MLHSSPLYGLLFTSHRRNASDRQAPELLVPSLPPTETALRHNQPTLKSFRINSLQNIVLAIPCSFIKLKKPCFVWEMAAFSLRITPRELALGERFPSTLPSRFGYRCLLPHPIHSRQPSLAPNIILESRNKPHPPPCSLPIFPRVETRSMPRLCTSGPRLASSRFARTPQHTHAAREFV